MLLPECCCRVFKSSFFVAFKVDIEMIVFFFSFLVCIDDLLLYVSADVSAIAIGNV